MKLVVAYVLPQQLPKGTEMCERLVGITLSLLVKNIHKGAI
jgi:hypothetical protein